MYRYGDGTPFPLDENFIETLTSAVEACTSAFVPLVDMDDRRAHAKEARRDGDKEVTRLVELEKTMATALGPYLSPADKKGGASAMAVAQKVAATVKQSVVAARQHVDGKVAQLEAQAAPRSRPSQIVQALGAFFDRAPAAEHEVDHVVGRPRRRADGERGRDRRPAGGAVLARRRRLARADPRRPARRRGRRAHDEEGRVRQGQAGADRARKYVWSRSSAPRPSRSSRSRRARTKASPGLRFAVSPDGATWVSITAAGDAEGEANPLDAEDVDGVRRLADAANKALSPLLERRALVDLTFLGKAIAELPEPQLVPLELLSQLTPLSRTIRERSRMSGELVLKRDIGDNRREELFVPRATLAQQFLGCPQEYRKPFEDMGIASEDTQPAICRSRGRRRAARRPACPSARTRRLRSTAIVEVEVEK